MDWMPRTARIFGVIAGLAFTVSSVVIGVTAFGLIARGRNAEPQVSVALAYWREGCIPPDYNRVEDVDEAAREFRGRLDQAVDVEMRLDPRPGATRVTAEVCIEHAGQVVSVVEDQSELSGAEIVAFQQVVGSWRFRAGRPGCLRDTFWVRWAD